MIALVTAASALDHDHDMQPLLDVLGEGVVTVWDDPTVDWGSFDAVVIRSTWDYQERREAFVEWARRVESATALTSS